MRGRGAATNLRLKTLEKQALNELPLETFECVPALGVKTLLRYVPSRSTLTYVLEMLDSEPLLRTLLRTLVPLTTH